MSKLSDNAGYDDRKLVRTVPCRYRSAAAAAVAATRAGAPSPGGAKSTEYLVNEPKMLTWLMVWLAPVSRSSGG
jgi:hypothetical protein